MSEDARGGDDGIADDLPTPESTFTEPWQARAFALAVSMTREDDRRNEEGDHVTVDDGRESTAVHEWEEFQSELVAEIDAQELPLDDGAVYECETPSPSRGGDEERYYRQWLSALEHLLTGDGTVDRGTLRERAQAFATGARDAHEFVDGDPHAHAERLPDGHADGSDHVHDLTHGNVHDHLHADVDEDGSDRTAEGHDTTDHDNSRE